MAINYNTRIVTNGLVLCLDAANPKSYPGTGATWYDLSGNNFNASIVGTNVWDSTFGGQFNFGNVSQTTQYIVLPHLAAQSTNLNYTLEFWLRPISVTGPVYFSSIAITGNDNYFILQQNASTLQRYTATGSISYTDNEILQFCVVRNGSDTGLLYKNGISVSSTLITTINAAEGWILNQEQDSVGGNFDPAQNFRGAFMAVRLYDRNLSSDEIKQNFSAHRGRYGI